MPDLAEKTTEHTDNDYHGMHEYTYRVEEIDAQGRWIPVYESDDEEYGPVAELSMESLGDFALRQAIREIESIADDFGRPYQLRVIAWEDPERAITYTLAVTEGPVPPEPPEQTET